MQLNMNTAVYQQRLHETYEKMCFEGKDEWSTQAEMRVASKFLVDSLGNSSRSSMLDIGCGVGKDTEFLADLGAFVTGIDIIEQPVWVSLKNRYNIKFFRQSIYNFQTNKKLCWFGTRHHFLNSFLRCSPSCSRIWQINLLLPH